MTTTFQQAIQLIALGLGFGFLNQVAQIAAFEPVQDLVWKLLMSLAFVYMATRVPSMLGNAGTFDSWLSTLYFGLSLPASMARSARTIGLIAGGAAGGPGGAAAGATAASAGLSAAASGVRLCGFYGDPVRGRSHRRWTDPQERQRVISMKTTTTGAARAEPVEPTDAKEVGAMCR